MSKEEINDIVIYHAGEIVDFGSYTAKMLYDYKVGDECMEFIWVKGK